MKTRYALLSACVLLFGLGFLWQLKPQGATGFGFLASNGGTPKGFAIRLNAGTGMSLTMSGATATIAATGSAPVRAIGAGFDGAGSALTAGSTATTYFTVPYGCTIQAWNITVDTGTISFDVWKIASGTAIPTVSNSILSGGFLSISSGTALHSTTLTDFTTTTVTANDIFGINIEAVSSATKASLVLQCQ
jgi:hypothetical protein